MLPAGASEVSEGLGAYLQSSRHSSKLEQWGKPRACIHTIPESLK